MDMISSRVCVWLEGCVSEMARSQDEGLSRKRNRGKVTHALHHGFVHAFNVIVGWSVAAALDILEVLLGGIVGGGSALFVGFESSDAVDLGAHIEDDVVHGMRGCLHGGHGGGGEVWLNERLDVRRSAQWKGGKRRVWVSGERKAVSAVV